MDRTLIACQFMHCDLLMCLLGWQKCNFYIKIRSFTISPNITETLPLCFWFVLGKGLAQVYVYFQVDILIRSEILAFMRFVTLLCHAEASDCSLTTLSQLSQWYDNSILRYRWGQIHTHKQRHRYRQNIIAPAYHTGN